MNEVCCGIDVSAKSLAVSVLRSPQQALGKAETVENTAIGHRQLIQSLQHRSVTRVVCEATGVYHLELAFALKRAGIALMVANPRQVKAFIEARLRHSQTDPVDAYELAQFAWRMDFVPWQPPSPAAFALHRIARSLHGYVEQATATKNRLHAESLIPDTPKVILQALRQELRSLERLQDRLDKSALELIEGELELKRGYDLLCSVPGIAHTSAVRILGELVVLPPRLSAKAWVKLAGLDPTRKQSGTSVLGKAHISKRGNAKLRGALFMPALSARRHDPGLRAFAERLLANGKSKLQVILAVARKLLHGIHAMLRLDQPWNSAALVPQSKTS
jgi:transposase